MSAHTRDSLLANVESVTRDLLGLAPELELPLDQRLDELGLDSLLAVDLAMTLSDNLEIELPHSLVQDHPTARAITDFLAQELGA